MLNRITLKAFANSSPGFALKPWGESADLFSCNSEGVATALRLTNGAATPSELRLQKIEVRGPRVAKARPWAGTSQRFQRTVTNQASIPDNTPMFWRVIYVYFNAVSLRPERCNDTDWNGTVRDAFLACRDVAK